MIDNLTRFVTLRAAKDTKTTGVIRELEDFVLQYAAPIRIVSDRGTCFTSSQFRQFCESHGIRHVLTWPRHPQANGMIERVNATLLPAMLASLQREDGRDWDQHLRQIQRDLNMSPNQTTGKSPFELLYGFVPRHDEGIMQAIIGENQETYLSPSALQEEARERILRNKRYTRRDTT